MQAQSEITERDVHGSISSFFILHDLLVARATHKAKQDCHRNSSNFDGPKIKHEGYT